MEKTIPNPNEVAALRTLVDDFIHTRLTDKLDKLKDGEDDKRQQLIDSHRRANWVADAARRVGQIQLASHTLKPLHPDARGTNLYLDQPFCQDSALVGTHVLGNDRSDDVVGNAAALDVFKFLKLSHDGRSLLNRALVGDAALAHALHDNMDDSQDWLRSFAGIVQQRVVPSSHTLAKQLYFPMPNGGYHVLAPLYPTALVHCWYKTLEHDRFSEASKEARQARKEQRHHAHGYAEYLNLAVQNFGGTKPQNISQLNSERRGEAYLLASFPPDWQRQPLSSPTKNTSVFTRLGAFVRQPHVIGMTKSLRKYLDGKRDRTSTVDIRQERSDRIDQILDALFTYQDDIRSLPPGWSLAPTCKLNRAECIWLDPDASDEIESESESNAALGDVTEFSKHWTSEIAARFATWLNGAISTPNNPMADEEHEAWRKKAQARLVWEAQQ